MSLRAEEVNGAHDIPIPVGWREAYDDVSGEVCYVNIATGVKVCTYIHTYIHTFHRSLRLSPDNRMWNMSKAFKTYKIITV